MSKQSLILRTMWVVAALAIAVPLIAQESDRNADGQWQDAFQQEYQRLVDEAGIPPEVASMVREQVGPGGPDVAPELAAGLAAEQAARVEAALRRGARPNQVAAEARSTLRREIARRTQEAEEQPRGEAAEGTGPSDGVPPRRQEARDPGWGGSAGTACRAAPRTAPWKPLSGGAGRGRRRARRPNAGAGERMSPRDCLRGHPGVPRTPGLRTGPDRRRIPAHRTIPAPLTKARLRRRATRTAPIPRTGDPIEPCAVGTAGFRRRRPGPPQARAAGDT